MTYKAGRGERDPIGAAADQYGVDGGNYQMIIRMIIPAEGRYRQGPMIFKGGDTIGAGRIDTNVGKICTATIMIIIMLN